MNLVSPAWFLQHNTNYYKWTGSCPCPKKIKGLGGELIELKEKLVEMNIYYIYERFTIKCEI